MDAAQQSEDGDTVSALITLVDLERLVQSWQLAAFDHEYEGDQLVRDLVVVS